MLNVFVTAVLAFLFGMGVGIAGYFACTILRYEKEIEAIFDRVVERYEKKIKRKEEENKRLHDSLMEAQVRLARKEKRS